MLKHYKKLVNETYKEPINDNFDGRTKDILRDFYESGDSNVVITRLIFFFSEILHMSINFCVFEFREVFYSLVLQHFASLLLYGPRLFKGCSKITVHWITQYVLIALTYSVDTDLYPSLWAIHLFHWPCWTNQNSV